MRILISGATGLVGAPLARRLLLEGHEVVALTRNGRRAERRLPADCRVAEWLPQNRVARETIADVDVVVHLAGAPVAERRWTEARKTAICASRIETTRGLADALAALPPSRRPRAFVAASAVGYYGDRGAEILGEDSPPGSGFLAEVCRRWEQEVERIDQIGIRTTRLRIGPVLGREGGALARMLPLFRLGLGGTLGGGRQWMSWIHLDDVVGLLCHAIQCEEVYGPINGVAPAPVTNADFTRILARVLRRPALLPIPAAALRLAWGQRADIVLASQRAYPLAASSVGYRFRHPRLEGALVDLCADDESVLEREQWLPRPPRDLFPFFSDALNLEQITPDFLRFRVLATSTPKMRAGTTIDYRLRLHGLPLRWQSRIDAWQPGESFVDRQTCGPYRLWHHTHEFEPRNGGTLMRDRVRYRLPFGALGRLLAGSLVQRDLEAIFDFRHARLRELFERRQGAVG